MSVAACGRLFAVPLALLALMILATPASAYLYFGQSNTRDCPIARANLDGSSVDHDFIIQATCQSPAVGAAHIYWIYTTGNHNNIARANIDGSAVNRSFIVLHGYAGGIAVDGAHIYWSDTTGIGRANLDGSGVDPSFLKLAGRAEDLAVDAAHIYWSDSSGIGRANLDGTQPNPGFIAATIVSGVSGIAVDSAYIYWTNFGSPPIGGFTGTIGRANLDGSGADPQFIAGASGPAAVAVDSSYVYWANHGSGTIGRASLDGSAADESFIRNASATGGLAVDALTSPPRQQAGAAKRRCRSNQLSVKFGGLSAAAGRAYQDLAFVNHGPLCTLRGWPRVTFLGASGSKLSLRAPTRVKESVRTVTLTDGGRAYTTFKYTNEGFCSPSVIVSAVRLTPPGDRAALVLHRRFSVCTPDPGAAVYPVRATRVLRPG